MPFGGANEPEILENISRGKFSMKGKAWKHVSKQAKDFINKMMNPDVTKRLTAE